MWAGLLNRQAAEAVGQGLGGPAQPLLGPGRLGQRSVGVNGNVSAGDVDLACRLPVPTDGRVVQPGVVSRHLRRVVIEDAADDFLGHVPVEQPSAQGVAPLVRGEVDRLPVGVTYVAALHPAVERGPVGGRTDRGTAIGVLRRPREQASCGTDP